MLILEKASQWSYGYITPTITEVNLGKKKEITSDKFQRTFTFDGMDILSAMSEVSQECNVIFDFDTENRKINVYNKFTLGEDTTVLVNRRNFASSIQIEDLKDEVKNCFRVSGGDDVITNYFSAVNITGNYIYDLSYQEEDMPETLSSAIHDYIDYKDSLNEEYYGGYEVYDLLANKTGISAIPKYLGRYSTSPTPTQTGCYYFNITSNKYYIWNGTSWEIAGAFVRYCSANDTLAYYEHEMAPTVGLVTTTAREQAEHIKSELETITSDYSGVVLSVTVSSSDFAIATNNILAYAKVLIDSRYTIKNLVENGFPNVSNKTWSGRLQIYKTSDETDNYIINVNVPFIYSSDSIQNQLLFAKQKIYKSLASNSTYEVDEYIVQITQGLDVDSAEFKRRIKNYMSEYNLTELKTYYDAFQSCLNILDTYYNLGSSSQSAVFETIYKSYKVRVEATKEVIQERQKQVDEYSDMVDIYSQEIATIQQNADFKTYLDNISSDLWTLFNSYRREDTYQNDNYISDRLNDGQILAKCKELLDAAQYNLSIACRLQHTLSVSINNLLIMPEFKEFWDKFTIFNYIRVSEDDLIEPYKLQLIQADFDFDNPSEINVTFATNISGSGNVLNSLESVITQSVSIGTNFSSVTQQATHGDSAKSQVSTWISDGLNVASTQVKNADNEEVTVNNYGILLRSETDEGQYDPFQVKLTGQGMFYTGDNWDHVLGCLGRIYIQDTPSSGHWDSGLIANSIIGNLIAGTSLKITNSSGSFVLDKDKATFTDISINYTDSDGRYVRIGDGYSVFKIGKGNTDQLYFDTSVNKLTLTGTVKASSIEGGSINITNNGKYFKVNSIGTIEVKQTNLTITSDGSITASNTNLSGTLSSINGNYKAELSSGSLRFYYNDSSVAEFTSTRWGSDDSKRGAAINSPNTSKYIAFNVPSDNSWAANFLINNGLNPNGIQEGIIAFDGMCVNKLTFKNGSNYDPNQYFINPVMYKNYWWGLHIDPGAYCVIGDANNTSVYSDDSPVVLTVNGDIAIHNNATGNWLTTSWGDFRLAEIEIENGISRYSVKSVEYTFDTPMRDSPFVIASFAMGRMEGLTVSVNEISSLGFTVNVASSNAMVSGTIYVHCIAISPRDL